MGRRSFLNVFRVALLVSSLAAAAATSFSMPQGDAAGLFRQGVEMEQAGRHQEALELFRRAVELNGLYGVAAERENHPTGFAGRLVTLFQLDGEGSIERIYFVMASRKLKAVPAVRGTDAGSRG
jgi:hypothetical protein